MAGFTERLKTLRKQENYSQQELADKMKVTKQTVSQYERGVRKPDYDTILFLCDIFNVSADYLLGKADVTVRLLSEKELEKLSKDNSVSQDEYQIIKCFRNLNNDGKQRLSEYAYMLSGNKAFLKDTELQKEKAM